MIEVSPNIKLILSTLPERPGVYQHLNDKGEIIYVGKAKNLKKRVNSYFNKNNDSFKTKQLVKNIADIRYIIVESEQDAFLLENNLIKKYQPHYNILLKDGKSYPSLCISREEYPKVYKTRNIQKQAGEYFGPYSYSNTCDLVNQLIHELYPIRTCNLPLTEKSINENKYKVCLKYHIKKCCGVCEGKIDKSEYNNYIKNIREIIKGNAEAISAKYLNEMREKARKLQFEEAQQLKEKYDLIEKFRSKTIITNTSIDNTDVFGYFENNNKSYIAYFKISKGAIVQATQVEYTKREEEKEEVLSRAISEIREKLNSEAKNIIVPFQVEVDNEEIKQIIPQKGDKLKLLQLAEDNAKQLMYDNENKKDKLNPQQKKVKLLEKLQQLLHLDTLPTIIESFDNSNIQGTSAVAACIVYKMGRPSKQDYRKYNIKTVEGADDYASMREVTYRRYKRIVDEKGELPNLIIADGGIGQMKAIRESVEERLHLNIPIAGLVKNDKHRTSALLYGNPAKEIGIRPNDELFFLLTQMQDEVHRYAISFHKDKRSKKQIKSELDEIGGIGEKTKNALMKQFKSVKRISNANFDELANTIGNAKATIIYNHFNNKITT